MVYCPGVMRTCLARGNVKSFHRKWQGHNLGPQRSREATCKIGSSLRSETSIQSSQTLNFHQRQFLKIIATFQDGNDTLVRKFRA